MPGPGSSAPMPPPHLRVVLEDGGEGTLRRANSGCWQNGYPGECEGLRALCAQRAACFFLQPCEIVLCLVGPDDGSDAREPRH